MNRLHCTAWILLAFLFLAAPPANAIGSRTEDPGAFLSWPLPPQIGVTAIMRLPDTAWTHHFLGITTCPPYPALLDEAYWPHVQYGGTYPGSRDFLLPGTPDNRARWQNADDTDALHNAIACYGANSDLALPAHEGVDITAPDGTPVLAAADGIVEIIDLDGDEVVALRHADVNGSGQTWYTAYRHLNRITLGGLERPVNQGDVIGEVGSGHLHFEVWFRESSGIAAVRNPMGIDAPPWDGCLWLDITLCPMTRLRRSHTDFNADGFSDVALLDTTPGSIPLRIGLSNGSGFDLLPFPLANVEPNALPVSGDFNGDGYDDLALFSPHVGGGSWEINRSEGQSFHAASPITRLGEPDDVPLVGDFNGDGIDEPGVFHPLPIGGTWQIALADGSEFAVSSWAEGWGEPGDVPLAADFDGDGDDDAALFSPQAGGLWEVGISNGERFAVSRWASNWGASGDVPFVGDFDGDGRADAGLFQPRPDISAMQIGLSHGTSFQISNWHSGWGEPGSLPLTGDFNGDGKTDLALYTSGKWEVGLSDGQRFDVTTWAEWGEGAGAVVGGNPG